MCALLQRCLMTIGQLILIWVGVVMLAALVWCVFAHSRETDSDND